MRALLALTAALAMVTAGLTTSAAPAQALTADRYAGADRYATSVEISRNTDAGSIVFLANGQKFPDALSAGPVVAAEQGHLLLTKPDELPAVVAARIAELAPTEIVIVGSEASVSAAVAETARGINGAEITRIGGSNRVETSLMLLDRLLESGPVETVWVASGFNFPDALVAASVAGQQHAAVILDHHGTGEAASQSWLNAVQPYVDGRVVNIAGGEPSVSRADAAGLSTIGATQVSRYAGDSRYTTARIINDAFATEPLEPRMLLATGKNFPDALAGAVHAATHGVPMYLTPATCNTQIADMLRGEAAERGIERVIGLGSSATVSDQALSLEPCPLTLQQTIAAQYGTFAPQQHSGSGNRLIDLGARGIPYAQLRATMSSNGTNRVTVLDANRQVLDEPVAYQGPYSGTALLAAFHERPARYLQVETTGAWTVRVADLASAPVLGTPQSGQRDTVFIYGGAARTVTARHGGGLFAVIELFDSGQFYRVPFEHCCEAINASSTMGAGPAVVAVMSDSPWSLTVQSWTGSATDDRSTRDGADSSVAERSQAEAQSVRSSELPR